MSTADRASFLSVRTGIWTILAVGGIVLWLVFAGGADGVRAWRSLLINFLFFTSFAGGLVVWPAIVRSANGAWHRGIERFALSGIGFAMPSLVALIVLWIGSGQWAPWYLRKYPQGAWLHNSFVFGRDLAALAIFWGVALRYLVLLRRGGGRVMGGVLIAVYCLVFSLLGMDLVMSLDPAWSSTLAGAYFFMTGLYIAITGWAFIAVWRPEALSRQLLDLGRLIVAFSLMSTYMMYSHLLPIWYEALPREVRFIVPRMNFEPWSDISHLLLATVYLGPLVFLLMERSKRNRVFLGAVSLLVLACMWIERWWLVAPTFHRTLSFGMIELSMLAGLLGLLGLGMEIAGRRLPEEPPEREETEECRE